MALMRTVQVAHCCLCGTRGRARYHELKDRVYATPGEWTFAECPAPRCGLLWLDPMPVAEDLHQAYATYYTHGTEKPRAGAIARFFDAVKRGYVANRFGYDATAAQRLLGLLAWIYPGRASELDFSVLWLARGTRGRLLDVGSGSGWLVEHLHALGWDAEGLDFDPRSVERGRERGRVMHLGALPAQRFAAGRYDALTMSHSIEHVHDPVGWLTEARRILKPGGRLALATPNTASYLHRRYGAHWFALEPPRHLHLFNRLSLDAALRKAGFERFRIFTSARDATGVFVASRSIRRSGRFDVFARVPPLQRALARGVQLQEAALLRIDPDAGEDLVAIAVR